MNNPRNIFIASALMLVLFMQVIYGIPLPMNYVFLIVATGFVFMKIGEGCKTNLGCILLLCATMLSIVGNDIPQFFKPWPRFALFALVMISCSPMLSGPGINKVHRQINMGGLWACAIITLWSFVAYFTGQGQYIAGFVNGYMGVTGHPNFLGFYAMVTMVALASLFFRCTNMKERIIIGSCWAACIIVLLVCASRSATGLGLVGSIVAAYLRLQKDKAKQMRLYMLGVCAAIMCWPVLAPYADTMMKKEMNFDDGGEAAIAATRGAIWDLRYQELAQSPLIGIGAYSCDTTLPNADIFYDATNGSIELGSSYLGLLAQCGWLGFIAFLLIVVPVTWKTFVYATRQRTPYAQFLFPILVVCILHMFFEGYLMTAGAIQCVVVWMLIGACDQCDTVADYPVAWEKEDPITPEQYVYWREHIAEDGDKR